MNDRNNRQIKDLKNELRKYEIEVENLADLKHKETLNFLNNLPSKSIDKVENLQNLSDVKEGISFRESNFY